MPDITPAYNPAAVCGIGRESVVNRLMRACGMTEPYITGDAPAYDKLQALAEALSGCAGHPLRIELNRRLSDDLGRPVTLTPATVCRVWQAWVEKNWYGRSDSPISSLDLCDTRTPLREPERLTIQNVCSLETILSVSATDSATFTAALTARLPEAGDPILLPFPDDAHICRPDPYHVGLALAKSPDARTEDERNLIFTQVVRLLGERVDGRNRLCLTGGTPTAAAELFAYLHSQNRLPETVWFPHEPSDATPIVGQYHRVRIGLYLPEPLPPDILRATVAAYAAVSPIGYAVLLTAHELDGEDWMPT